MFHSYFNIPPRRSWWINNYGGIPHLFEKYVTDQYKKSGQVRSYRTYNLCQALFRYLFRRTDLLNDTDLDEYYFYNSTNIFMIHNEYMCAAVHEEYAGLIMIMVSPDGLEKSGCGEGFINEINPIAKTFGIKHSVKKECLILSDVPLQCYYPIINAMLVDDLVDKTNYSIKFEEPEYELPIYQNEMFGKIIRWIYHEVIKPLNDMLNVFGLKKDSGIRDVQDKKQELSRKFKGSIEIYDNFVKYCDQILMWNKIADVYWNTRKRDGTLTIYNSIRLEPGRWGILDIMYLEYDFALLRENNIDMFNRLISDKVFMSNAMDMCDLTISSKKAISNIRSHKKMVQHIPSWHLSKYERTCPIPSTSVMMPEDPDLAYALKQALAYNYDSDTFDGVEIY